MDIVIIRCLYCPVHSYSSSYFLHIYLWLLEIALKVNLRKCHRRQLMTKLRLQKAISKLAKESLANSKVSPKYEQTEAIWYSCFIFLSSAKTVPGKQEKGKT